MTVKMAKEWTIDDVPQRLRALLMGITGQGDIMPIAEAVLSQPPTTGYVGFLDENKALLRVQIRLLQELSDSQWLLPHEDWERIDLERLSQIFETMSSNETADLTQFFGFLGGYSRRRRSRRA